MENELIRFKNFVEETSPDTWYQVIESVARQVVMPLILHHLRMEVKIVL